jgi:hypothetical protein
MQNLITEYYGHLVAALSTPNIITERIRIGDVELMNFDDTKPVYLQQYGRYFAVLEITAQADGTAEVQMLTLSEGGAAEEPEPPTPVLPYDAEVEYLESTGTQYILNIPVTITNATYEIETKINVLRTFNYNNIFSFGRDVTTLECWYAGGFYYRHNQTRIGGSNFGGLNVTYTYKFVFNGTTLVSYKDGVQYSSNNVSNCENPNVLRLFTRQDLNTNNSNFRLYGFSLIKDNIKVLDLIPVRVGQTGYLYDKVSGTLFGNAGSGDFIIGNDKNT